MASLPTENAAGVPSGLRVQNGLTGPMTFMCRLPFDFLLSLALQITGVYS